MAGDSHRSEEPDVRLTSTAAVNRDEERPEGRVARLSDAKQRLLEQRMRAGMQPEQAVRPRAAGARVPLSAEQRRIWLHALQQPDVPIYNEAFTIYKHGRFDLGILEASFNEVLRRHEIWRTSFSAEGDQLVQPDVYIVLPLTDLSALSPLEREARARHLATEDAREPILISGFPLFRARVVRMSADEHRLYLTFHHIIFDGVSIARVFLPELHTIYTSLEAGGSSSLSEPPVQYGDYAIWREQHIESSEVQRHLTWWLDQLSGELPPLRLPEDHIRSASTEHPGSMECVAISDPLSRSLRQLSGSRGVTVYMTLLAAFAVLMFRYSGQSEIIIGSATDGRRRPELEKIIGYFLDTFAVRTRPTSEVPFSEYLSQICESVLNGVTAADVPFDMLVKQLNPKREPGRHPIFQVFFTMRPVMPSLDRDWSMGPTDVIVGASKFDLHLEVADSDGEMDARFFYRTDIWEASTIRRMAAHWLTLLQSIERNPALPLGSLGLLTPEEVSSCLEPGGWNDTARPLPQVTVQGLIERQVRLTPRKTAATFGKDSWTYERLDSRAEAIAGMLRAAGVTRGTIVAIVLDRSLDLLAGLLAVLKTGAAYLPIDITMPVKRIELCLADARPSAILTQRSLVQQVDGFPSAIVLVDGNQENSNFAAANHVATKSRDGAGDPEDLAYLIYTSGTTGEPKAVEILQRSLVNLLTSMQTNPGFGTKDTLLAVTPISFDIAALELFLPLISGGTVVVANREQLADPNLLADEIGRSACTVVQATPTTWRALLLSGWNNARPSNPRKLSRALRVLCGGEALNGELADRILATGAELWNMYGPTETTIWSLIHRVRPGKEKKTRQVSVGRPIANTTAFILDAKQQLLPVGIPGELYLGGVGLAIRYKGKPEQTADRFRTVESAGGLRLYRTGDLAVQRPDGTIDILGRTDNQVKVRGHRIELEAVEAAVLRHPSVAAAAAGAWPEANGDLRLSVFVVAVKGSAPPGVADLRAFLRSSCPDYMIPSDVIALPSLPLTAHGKIDRPRLPRPAVHKCEPPHSRPDSVEAIHLAAIWADLLGYSHIGLDDNFFDLGGHSLLVVALQHRIANHFGRRIPVVELFQNPTVRQQARLTREPVEDEFVLPPGVHALQPRGSCNSIFWVHYLGFDLAKELGPGQPFISVGLTPEDVTLLGQTPTLQRIAACLLRKILATQSEGPYTVGGLCLGGILAFEIASQLQAAGREVSLLVLLDPPNPSYLNSCAVSTRKMSYLRYATKRAARLGPGVSVKYLREHLLKRLPRSLRGKRRDMHKIIAREMIETATLSYEPGKYGGKVLLLLAAERAPHVDFLPGWRAVIPTNLHLHYVDGHHRDLTRSPHVKGVADAILRQLRPDGEGR